MALEEEAGIGPRSELAWTTVANEQIAHPLLVVDGEFAGVEEHAVAEGAGFEPEIWLGLVHDADHQLVVHWTANEANLVVASADHWITGIDCLGARLRSQVLVFQQIEPEPAATATAIDLDAGKRHRAHRVATLGTAQWGRARGPWRFLNTVVHLANMWSNGQRRRNPGHAISSRTTRVALKRPR